MIFRSIRQSVFFLLLMLSVALLIVACRTNSVEQSLRSGSKPAANDCRIVEHSMGETEVCGQPQKVAALSPHILDSMLALGVQPAAYADSEGSEIQIQTYDNPVQQIPFLGKWVTTQPIKVGDRKSPSLERLTLLQPNLILGEHFNNQDEYSLLTQIAPTLLFSDKNADGEQFWQNDIQRIAQALGKQAQAEELLKAFDKQIAQARTALQPVLQKYPRVFLISSNLTTYVYSQSEGTTSRLLQEIGFEIVQPEGTKSGTKISWEIVPQVETDLIIVLSDSDDSFYHGEDIIRKKWANNPLFNSMPVSQQGRVFFVGYYLWGSHTRGPLTDKLILEALPDLLLSTVPKIKS